MRFNRTARYSLSSGKDKQSISQGCKRLIKNGAKLVGSVEDIFEGFEFLTGFEKPIVNESQKSDEFQPVQKITSSPMMKKRLSGLLQMMRSVLTLSLDDK